MATHRWADVERELFPAGDEEKVRELEDQLRAEVRAYQLAEIRKDRHLTQRQVAEEMGVSTARVSQIEHGQLERAAIRGWPSTWKRSAASSNSSPTSATGT
jgi:DNA-binding XRE family transcriptional regulator